MVPVPASADWLGANNVPPLPDYFLDRFEVTNRQFQTFVDAGGYRDPKYWHQPFRGNGATLPREQAMAMFRDETGRPGPAGWRLGAFPAGQEDFPVSGVSWYEADAYCAFAGKALPTVPHWRKAAGYGPYSSILLFSNFSSAGPARVGVHGGVSAAGAYDMAGNVKEWCWNSSGELRAILGGGWNEPSYSYNELDAQDPLLRKPVFGIRCALYPSDVTPASLAPLRPPERNYVHEKPINDTTFQVFRSLYSYDPAPLDAQVESVEDSNPHWRAENVSYRAAYGGERISAKLYLPKNAKPPYQTVLWAPGGYAWLMHKRDSEIDSLYFDFLPQTGRAVLYPVYKGTYDRWIRGGAGLSAYRDMLVQFVKDVSRSVEFLESRGDVRRDKVAYYGLSSGAMYGPLALALDPRFRTAILLGGGLFTSKMPAEIDILNFAPRVRVPILMLNGRSDFSLPSETSQKPLFRWLGAPASDKRLLQFETGHMMPVEDIIREALNWLDRYLGPVQEKR
jgi:predicted esterase